MEVKKHGSQSSIHGDVSSEHWVRTGPGRETFRGAGPTAKLISCPTLVTGQPLAVTQSCRGLSMQRFSAPLASDVHRVYLPE